MGIGVAKLFFLFVAGGFVLGFGIPAFVFGRILHMYQTRFDGLAAQLREIDDDYHR
jgi:hypothetical protein